MSRDMHAREAFGASYQPNELTYGYLHRLTRAWRKQSGHLNKRSVEYVEREIEAAYLFTELSLRAGVQSARQVDTRTGEYRLYEYRPLAFARSAGQTAILHQLYFIPKQLPGMRSLVPMLGVYEKGADGTLRLQEKYGDRRSLQYVDCLALGTRGTPFHGSGTDYHLHFHDILKQRTRGEREGLELLSIDQDMYLSRLEGLRAGIGLTATQIIGLSEMPLGDNLTSSMD